MSLDMLLKLETAPPDMSEFLEKYGKDYFRVLVIDRHDRLPGMMPEIFRRREPSITFLLLDYNEAPIQQYEGFGYYIEVSRDGNVDYFKSLGQINIELKSSGIHYGTVHFKGEQEETTDDPSFASIKILEGKTFLLPKVRLEPFREAVIERTEINEIHRRVKEIRQRMLPEAEERKKSPKKNELADSLCNRLIASEYYDLVERNTEGDAASSYHDIGMLHRIILEKGDKLRRVLTDKMVKSPIDTKRALKDATAYLFRTQEHLAENLLLHRYMNIMNHLATRNGYAAALYAAATLLVFIPPMQVVEEMDKVTIYIPGWQGMPWKAIPFALMTATYLDAGYRLIKNRKDKVLHVTSGILGDMYSAAHKLLYAKSAELPSANKNF